MNPDKPNNNPSSSEEVRQELAQLSPLLAKLAKPDVPMPADSYFASLADAAMPRTAPQAAKPTRIFRLMPVAASMAVAASITLAIIFWPTTTADAPTPFSLSSLTDAELMQLALQDDDLMEDRMLDDGALLAKLDANDAFQYFGAPKAADEAYNKLLLELIDDETLSEDW